MANNSTNKYDEDFKKSLVSLYHNGKIQTQLCKEYGVSQSLPPNRSRHCKNATLKQRLNAVHTLRFRHNIKTLCRVLRLNRSTYYKHFYSAPAPRTTINQHLKRLILHIYADYDKRLGAYKTRYILERDYGIHIRVGRVYRLMQHMDLPKMLPTD